MRVFTQNIPKNRYPKIKNNIRNIGYITYKMYYSSYILLLLANYNSAFVKYHKQPILRHAQDCGRGVRLIGHAGGNSTAIKSDDAEKEPDIIEKYSDWFGWFPKEQKWKSVRFTFYSIAAGYTLAESFQVLNEWLTHKPINDFFDK
ncbi:MAG: hypothetical protein CML47_01205 [Rhodobacteraceae bacterium]|nr:MAG: hypothetical protein CML47_01205 [Paracoccaceae bacterium]